MDIKVIYDVADAIQFLKTKGTKVAIQMGYEGPYVFVEKGDFLKTLKSGPRTSNCSQFTGPREDAEPVFAENNVLHIPIGVTF